MIKHIVLFKLKNKADASKAIEAFYSMKGKIKGMLDLEAGTDFLESERSYDVALVCTFTDKSALESYQTDPVHLPVKKLMHEIRTASVAVDFIC
ncbi:MAG: Dabb family protein [Firmicutes bacterium]|nr:Dabb family protein [Bacillota bacterium]